MTDVTTTDTMTDGERHDRTINYVEFNVTDIARSKRFYGSAFGWTFRDYGPTYCEFSDGHMKGGFDAGEADSKSGNGRAVPPAGGPLVVLYAQDLEAVLGDIVSAGGTLAKPITAFPGGRRFHFTDPDGYELAVWSE